MFISLVDNNNFNHLKYEKEKESACLFFYTESSFNVKKIYKNDIYEKNFSEDNISQWKQINIFTNGKIINKEFFKSINKNAKINIYILTDYIYQSKLVSWFHKNNFFPTYHYYDGLTIKYVFNFKKDILTDTFIEAISLKKKYVELIIKIIINKNISNNIIKNGIESLNSILDFLKKDKDNSSETRLMLRVKNIRDMFITIPHFTNIYKLEKSFDSKIERFSYFIY